MSIFLDFVIIKVQNKGGNLIAKERYRKMKLFNEVGTVFKDLKPAKKWDAIVSFFVYCGEWENVNSPEYPGTIKSEEWYEDKKGNLNIVSENWKKCITIRRTYPTRTQAYKAAKKIAKRMPKNYVLSFISISRAED